jgi:alkanesulfonate monooxygenase SsuD/methylene tetrahydromethanopterin reductase-like flavin-dependent oxidoreductase (luciferase family)
MIARTLDTMVTAAMRFMYAYPETHGTDRDMLDAGPISEVAQTAEAAGFGGFAFTEHPSPGARWLASGGHQSLDPFVALSYVAAVTTSIKLLTYLSVMPYRNPLLLAKTTATLDKLSGGRLILGVGTGYLKGEFRALGVDIEERNDLFDEALDALPLHWSGEPFGAATDPHLDRRQRQSHSPARRRAGAGLDALGRPGRGGEDGPLTNR